MRSKVVSMHNLVDTARMNADVMRQPILRDAQWLQEFFEQNLAGMHGSKFGSHGQVGALCTCSLDLRDVCCQSLMMEFHMPHESSSVSRLQLPFLAMTCPHWPRE